MTTSSTSLTASRPMERGPASRYTRYILLGALLLALAAGIFGLDAPKHLMQGGFDDPGSESTRADQMLGSKFTSSSPNLVAILSTGVGVDYPESGATAQRVINVARADASVSGLTSYWDTGAKDLKSKDGTKGLILIRLSGSTDQAARNAERLTPKLREAAGDAHLDLSGKAQIQAETGARTEHDLLVAELIAAPITFLLLILVFGSLVSSLLPLAVAGIATVATMAFLKIVAAFTPVSVYSANITTALGLGLAIDYSLFIVSRFREQLAAGQAVGDAIATTMRTAGRTVLYSAVTVIVALSTLLLFPLFFLRSFAYGGVMVVVFAAAGALVVLPALLAVLGRRVDALDMIAPLHKRWTARDTESDRPSGQMWYRIAKAVMRRPIVYTITVLVLLIALGSPFLRASFGEADDRALPPTAPAHLASDILRTEFDESVTRTTPVLVDGGDERVTDAQINDYATRLSSLTAVKRVDSIAGTFERGQAVSPPDALDGRFVNGNFVWLQVVSTADPMSDVSTTLVSDIRQTPGPGRVLVGGTAAELVDTSSAIAARAPFAVGIIVIAMFVLLFLFTGSLVVPLKALVLNALSLTATFGVMVFVFQEGHLGWLIGRPIVTGHIDVALPILVFCVAFGLSMDYQVFLISRIREHHLATGDTPESIAFGLARTGRLITCAAGILAVVLILLATSGITLLKLVGVGLAVAIVVDATIVRGVLVPAVMKLAGEANWWAPRWLRRVHDRVPMHH